MGNLLYLPILYRDIPPQLQDEAADQSYIVSALSITAASQVAKLQEHGINVGVPFHIPREQAAEGGGGGAAVAPTAVPVSCLTYSLKSRSIPRNMSIYPSKVSIKEEQLDMYVNCRPVGSSKTFINAYVFVGAPEPDLTDGDNISISTLR